MSAYVSIRSICQHMSAYVSIRQHTVELLLRRGVLHQITHEPPILQIYAIFFFLECVTVRSKVRDTREVRVRVRTRCASICHHWDGCPRKGKNASEKCAANRLVPPPKLKPLKLTNPRPILVV